MIRTLLWVCLFCSPLISWSQARIGNVSFQLNSQSKMIEISYDAFNLSESDSVYVSVNGKKSGNIFPGDISGAIGKGIKPGKNLKVFWNIYTDNLKIDEELVVKVNVALGKPAFLAQADTTRRRHTPVVKKDNARRGINGTAVIMLGGGLAIGGGLYYLSTVKKAESLESYERYKERNWIHKDLQLIGNDPDLQKLYTDSYNQAKADYNQAKRQLMISKAMMFGGIAIALADAIFTIPNLTKSKGKRVGLLLDLDSRGVASAGVQLKF